ncbi:MAG: DUF1275 domain-containing protein [Micrococcales bacterium]|nr:DUF1275 domain-containing protein [Micrococcales bacterium]
MAPTSPRAWRSPVILLLALTFSTGVADAASYLGLDRVFAGNMTGNVIVLGMGLAGGTGLPVAGPVISLGAFTVGAAAGGRALRGIPSGWTSRARDVFAAVAAMLAVTAFVALTVRVHRGTEPGVGGLVVTGLLACSMGMQAAAARHVKVADLTTVVVTSTLTGLASDSWFGRRASQPWARRAGAVVLMVIGALAGALLLRIGIAAAIALSVVLTVVVVAAGRAVATDETSSTAA